MGNTYELDNEEKCFEVNWYIFEEVAFLVSFLASVPNRINYLSKFLFSFF